MKLIVEMRYEGECIEQRKYTPDNAPIHLPIKGDSIHVYFDNKHYTEEYGNFWKVHDRVFLLFDKDQNLQTVQLYIQPTKPEVYHSW